MNLLRAIFSRRRLPLSVDGNDGLRLKEFVALSSKALQAWEHAYHDHNLEDEELNVLAACLMDEALKVEMKWRT